MILCEIYKDKKAVSLELKGHAGFATEGSDIVCSAASILCYTFATVLGCIPETITENKIEKGDAFIEAKVTAENAEKLNGAVDFVAVGFGLLETAYPKNISMRKNF